MSISGRGLSRRNFIHGLSLSSLAIAAPIASLPSSGRDWLPGGCRGLAGAVQCNGREPAVTWLYLLALPETGAPLVSHRRPDQHRTAPAPAARVRLPRPRHCSFSAAPAALPARPAAGDLGRRLD